MQVSNPSVQVAMTLILPRQLQRTQQQNVEDQDMKAKNCKHGREAMRINNDH